MYKSKFTILQQEIIRFLFIKAGASFNARNLSKYLEVSQPAISKAMPLLEKKGFIKVRKDKESGRFSIELNRDNPLVINLKRTENLKLIYESGFAEFLENNFPGCTIILFGSYSRGDDAVSNEYNSHHSDIDIAIIGTKEKQVELSKFEKILERKIIINFYPSFKEIHKHLRNNILNGILLSGSVEL